MGSASFSGTGRFSRHLVHGGTLYLPEFCTYPGGETAFESCNYNSPSQMNCLPQQETPHSASLFMSSDHVRPWSSSVPQLARLGSNAFEEASAARPPMGLNPYLSTPAAGDGNTAFHGLGSLASYLPLSVHDRTLPNPKPGQISNVGEAALPNSHVYVSDSVAPSKNSIQWVERGESATMPSTTVPNPGNNMRTSSLRSSTNQSEQEDTPLGYEQLPLQGHSVSSEAASSTATSESSLNRIAATSTSIEDNGSVSNAYGGLTGLYTYSLSSSGRSSAQQLSEGTLLSGQTYTPIPHRPSHITPTQLCDPRKEPGRVVGHGLSRNPLTRVGGPSYR